MHETWLTMIDRVLIMSAGSTGLSQEECPLISDTARLLNDRTALLAAVSNGVRV